MKKLLLLLLIPNFLYAQKENYLLPDSSERVVFVSFQDSLENEFQNNSGFLDIFLEKFGDYYNNAQIYEKMSKTYIDELEMDIYESRSAQKKFLEGANISRFLKEYMNREADFQYWHIIYAYPVVQANQNQTLKNLISLPEVMIRSFDKNIFKKVDFLKSKAFRHLLPYWVAYENSRENNFVKYQDRLISINDKAEFSMRELTGIVLDYSLSNLVIENQQFISNSLVQNLVSQIDNDVLRKPFDEKFFETIFARNKQLEENKLAIAEKSKQNRDTMFYDLSGAGFDFGKYKGKVVYVDFWASWCGPCKVQFPYSKSLHEGLSDKAKKDIVFLYISIDDTEEKWRDGIKNNGLEGFEHGYTPGAWGSPVMQKLGIRSIPRYMILNKSGNIVEADAKRPSNPEILIELLKLI